MVQILSCGVIFYTNTVKQALQDTLIMLLLAFLQFLGSRMYSWNFHDTQNQIASQQGFMRMKLDASQFMYVHYSVKILTVIMGLILIILAATWEEIIDHFDDDGLAFKIIL